MLVLFQTFLMMARSSSLACSKLPGATDRPGQQHLTGPPLAQQMVAGFSLWRLLPWAQTLLGGNDCCAPGAAQPQVTFAPGLGFQDPEWLTAEAVPSCTPYRPRTVISLPHTWSVPPPPGRPPGAPPWPPPTPRFPLLALRGSLPCRCLLPAMVPFGVAPTQLGPHESEAPSPPPTRSVFRTGSPAPKFLPKGPQAHASHTNSAASRPTSIRAGCVRTEAG